MAKRQKTQSQTLNFEFEAPNTGEGGMYGPNQPLPLLVCEECAYCMGVEICLGGDNLRPVPSWRASLFKTHKTLLGHLAKALSPSRSVSNSE